MDLKAVESQIRNLPAGKVVYIEVASPPYGDCTGYHAILTRDEALELALMVAASDALDEVVVELDEDGEVLEKVDSRAVFYHLYPGAVYMHKGMYYEVTDVDRQAFVAEVRAIENCNFYTTLEVETEIRIVDKRATRPAGESFVSLGIVEVSATATQYMKKRIYSDEVMDVIQLDLPPRVFETVGIWFGPPPGRPAGPPGPLSGALAALEYVGVNALSMYAMCDPSDLIGASDFMHQDTGNPEVFLLDNHPGGVGISELGYSVVEQVWGRMRDMIATCPCTEGCPRCVDSPSRHNKDAESDKAGALRLLNTLLGRRAANGNGGRRKLPAVARS